MRAGDRFKGWIETVAESWKDRLRGWMASWMTRGFNELMEELEPEAIDLVKSNLAKILEHPSTPQDLKDVITTLEAGRRPLPLLLLIPIGVLMLIPMVTSIFQPLGNLIRYVQERVFHSWRLEPPSVITAWRRDPGKYARFFDDLKDQGWNDERIEALKYITEIIPGVADLIRMSVREAFSPEIAEKFGQYQDPPVAVYPWAKKLGLSQEWVDRYWAAHWDLPSAGQGFELLHRGVITEDELKMLLRALDVMPYWRDKLINVSWNVPTRVDLRRFWDMRTIDEERMREIYTSLGFHGKDLDDYVLWTKIYVDFPTLLARWKNGWITLDEVRQRLIKLGMPADRAEEMLQERIQAEGAERTKVDRDLTLTDIYKGVKQERISRAQAVGLIMDLGYDEEEAGFKLDVNVPADEQVSAVQQRQLTKTDILNGLRTDTITEKGARDMLLELRYAAADVEFLLKVYKASIKPPVETRLKEQSKADVLLGVKKGLITPEEGYGLLLDMEFTPDAAGFILMVHAEESPFSPVNYDEFKDRTQKWRLAAGMEGKPMAEEIKKLGAEVVRLSAEVETLQRSTAVEKKGLVGEETLPPAATARLTELQVALHRAEAELARVKTDYTAKLAEWKHGAK